MGEEGKERLAGWLASWLVGLSWAPEALLWNLNLVFFCLLNSIKPPATRNKSENLSYVIRCNLCGWPLCWCYVTDHRSWELWLIWVTFRYGLTLDCGGWFHCCCCFSCLSAQSSDGRTVRMRTMRNIYCKLEVDCANAHGCNSWKKTPSTVNHRRSLKQLNTSLATQWER